MEIAALGPASPYFFRDLSLFLQLCALPQAPLPFPQPVLFPADPGSFSRHCCVAEAQLSRLQWSWASLRIHFQRQREQSSVLQQQQLWRHTLTTMLGASERGPWLQELDRTHHN